MDVEAFELLVRRGEHLDRAGETAAALAVYAQAADLYGGDFLPDAWEDWVVFRREGLKDQLLFVLARLADASLAAGDYHDCIRRSRQILEHDRCREDAFRVLMLCHARLGQPGRVRRWFELCVRVLRSSLDADPDPATVRLYESVLQQPRSP